MKDNIKTKSIIALIVFVLFQILSINAIISFAGENISTQDIEEGVYIIKSSVNQDYVLDVDGGSKANEANVQLYERNDTNAQKWKIEKIDNRYYKITSVGSNKVLDVYAAQKTAGTNVWQYEFNNSDAQKWTIQKNADNTYSIISKCNGLCLDLDCGIAQNGGNIQVYDGNGTKAQKYYIESLNSKNTISADIAEETYIIKSALNQDYVLDVNGGAKTDGANVQLYERNDTNAQKWKIEKIDNRYYKITSVGSNKVLDVYAAQKTAGTNVWQYEFNNSDAQKWIIQKNSDNTYSIISKCNGLCLDVDCGLAQNGSNIQVYNGNGTKAQKFILENVEDNDQSEDTEKIEKEEKRENNNISVEPIKEEQKQIESHKTIEDGTYIIETAVSSNYVLDVSGGSKENEANVQIYEKNSTTSQKFKVEYIDGYYVITAQCSNKVLDVYCGLKKAGTNVWQYEYNNTDAQKWIIQKNSDDTYSIISKCNQLYLDLGAGMAYNGNNIQVYDGNGTNAQKFKFIKPSAIVNTIDISKYPGYKEKIEGLINLHPEWNFELLYTGLTFDEAIKGEYAVHSRNLVPSSYSGEWVCPICGTKLYDSGWYCASEKAIAYYMDPRNFLDDTNVFQFQKLNEYLQGICTLEGIQQKVSNTFLANYAAAIDNACKNQNVNPYYIIARVIQEQGTKGTTIGTGMNGGDGKTYYNPFNIGASGNGKTAIYNNALAKAKAYGWDTMQKALEGGISFCKDNWLENYQNTLYQNKFDIDKQNGTPLYQHQYMQNLMAAYSEARTLRGMYVNTGKIDSGFTFVIPLYENIDNIDNKGSQLPTNNSETSPINVQITANGGLRLRKEADTNSEKLRTVAQGEIVLSVQRGINSNWQKVIMTDGTIGYMSGTYLKQVADVTNCNYTAKVKTADGIGCNVRVGPSTRLDKITALSDGTSVTVINQGTYNNIDGFDWLRIQLNDGRQAFMPSKFLTR